MQVEADLYENVIRMTVKYDEKYDEKAEIYSTKILIDKLINRYQKMLKDHPNIDTKSCIVKIESPTGGSRLVRALYQLFKEIIKTNSNRQLICVGYPKNYIESLNSLGIANLPNFKLAKNEKEAIRKIKKENFENKRLF